MAPGDVARALPPGRGLRACAAACGAAVVLLVAGACGGSGGESGDTRPPETTTAAAAGTIGAGSARCASADAVSADLGIAGLAPVPGIPAPTATTTLVCGWAAGVIGEEGAATVRFSVDTLPDAATAANGYEFSRQTIGSCARTDTCDPGEDVADDLFEGDARSFVSADISDLTGIGDGPFFSTVIIAAARNGNTNCSLAINMGSADRRVLTAPVRPARRAVADYCRAQGE